VQSFIATCNKDKRVAAIAMMKEELTTIIDEAEGTSTLSQDNVIHTSLEIDTNASGTSTTSPVRRREDSSNQATDLRLESMDDEEEYEKDSKERRQPVHQNPTNLSSLVSSINATIRRTIQNPLVQKLLSLVGSIVIIILIKKLMRPGLLHEFLIWMENHPIKGLVAYLIIYPLHMVLILPGTPLCMGAGFVFKVQYGWLVGVSFCSMVTLFGSLLGSLICFLLGRYCFRTSVRRWSKKYPMFDPIDHAVSENGFKIMALIYLTPAVPLGPMSYMMGTTSMDIFDFAKAKIAALPMTALYVYLGAATGTLMMEGEDTDGKSLEGGDSKGMMHKTNMEELSLSPKLVVIGILFSISSIAFISIKMKKELQKVSLSSKKINFYNVAHIFRIMF